MEKCIIDIEKKMSFFEHELGQLNEVIIEQQKQIDELEKTVREIKQHGENFGLVKDIKDETPPPHY